MLPGSTIDEQRRNFLVINSGMAGAIAMLRKRSELDHEMRGEKKYDI
jgi:hypothetical protein